LQVLDIVQFEEGNTEKVDPHVERKRCHTPEYYQMGDYEGQIWICFVVLVVLDSFKISPQDAPLVSVEQADDDCGVEVVGVQVHV
jgi:hypothetical protein